jgi:hypothetical protein
MFTKVYVFFPIFFLVVSFAIQLKIPMTSEVTEEVTTRSLPLPSPSASPSASSPVMDMMDMHSADVDVVSASASAPKLSKKAKARAKAKAKAAERKVAEAAAKAETERRFEAALKNARQRRFHPTRQVLKEQASTARERRAAANEAVRGPGPLPFQRPEGMPSMEELERQLEAVDGDVDRYCKNLGFPQNLTDLVKEAAELPDTEENISKIMQRAMLMGMASQAATVSD